MASLAARDGDADSGTGGASYDCLFSIDIGPYFTIKTSMNQAKFDALRQHRTSSF